MVNEGFLIENRSIMIREEIRQGLVCPSTEVIWYTVSKKSYFVISEFTNIIVSSKSSPKEEHVNTNSRGGGMLTY